MSIEVLEYINIIITLVCTFIFLLLPYFLSLFAVNNLKSKGAYGKSNVNKSNVFMKFIFVIWFSIVTYYVVNTVIIDNTIKIITISLTVIIIIMFILNILRELRSIVGKVN